MKANCLNCGFENEVTIIFADELGSHIRCSNCGSTFDIDAEIINDFKPVSEPLRERGINIIGSKTRKVGITGHGMSVGMMGHVDVIDNSRLHRSELGIITGSQGKSHEIAEHVIAAAKEHGFAVVTTQRDKYMEEQLLTRAYDKYLFGDYGDMLGKIMSLDIYANQKKEMTDADYLKQYGYNTFELLKTEYDLIQEKKSKETSFIRSKIVSVYEKLNKEIK